MTRTRKSIESWLLLYSAAIILLSTGAWAIAAYRYEVLRQPAIYSTLTSRPDNRFTDLTSILPEASHPIGNGARIEGGPPIFNLAAPAIVPYWFLSVFGKRAVNVYSAMLLLAAVVGCAMIYGPLVRASIRKGTILLFLISSVIASYPLLFVADRGNVEGFVWMFILAGTGLLCSRRKTASAVCFALAGCIKPFPLILLLPFLYQGWLREAIIAGAVWASVNVGAFYVFGPTIRACWQAYLKGLQDYTAYIVTGYRPYDMNFDHSLFAVVRQIGRVIMGSGEVASKELYVPYLIVISSFVALVLWRIRKLPLTNQILACAFLMVLAPPANYDYTLVSIYPAFGVFVVCLAKSPSRTPFWVIAAVLACFAVTFTPQSFLLTGDTGIGGQVKAVFMLAILVIATLVPLSQEFFGISSQRL